MSLRSKLPSAQSLFAFEAAARCLNFTEAGRLLNVTQPAVSKSIAALEAHLGVRLFLRGKTGLALTPDGEILHRAIRLSFAALEDAIDRISRHAPRENQLTLSLSTSFAAHWLIPQMQAFRAAFPDVTLNFQLTGGEATGALGSCDLGLRLDSMVAPGDRAEPFAPEWLVAVASPEYIARNGTLDAPAAGGAHALVKLDTPRISWRQFLDATGQSIRPDLPEIRVPDYSVVLQSALNGRGVALGYMSSCSYLLREGLLVPALAHTLRTGRTYCLITNAGSPALPLAETVGAWICARSAQILREIAPQFAGSAVPAPAGGGAANMPA